MEHVKIVFLDIDGVLNSKHTVHRNWELYNDVRLSHALDHELCSNLNMVLALDTNIKLVISSTWRITHNERDMALLLFPYGITNRIIGRTPNLNGVRGDEIAEWFEINMDKYRATRFAIVDDSTDMGDFMPYLIRTSWEHGFSRENAKQLADILDVKL